MIIMIIMILSSRYCVVVFLWLMASSVEVKLQGKISDIYIYIYIYIIINITEFIS